MEAQDKTLNDVSEDNTNSNETNSEESSNGEETKTFSQADIDSAVKDARKDQDGRWKDRIKGLKGDDSSDESGTEDKEDHKEVANDDERYNRLELKTEGIKDAKEQDIVLDYAKFKGISVDEAVNTPAVKAELKEIRTANSTPSPSQRSGTGQRNEAADDAARMNKGESPPTAERRKAAREFLSRR